MYIFGYCVSILITCQYTLSGWCFSPNAIGGQRRAPARDGYGLPYDYPALI